MVNIYNNKTTESNKKEDTESTMRSLDLHTDQNFHRMITDSPERCCPPSPEYIIRN